MKLKTYIRFKVCINTYCAILYIHVTALCKPIKFGKKKVGFVYDNSTLRSQNQSLSNFLQRNRSLFHFQKNFAESSYCFCVAITFLHQPSTLTCRHVLNFAAVKRAQPSPTPHHASPKSALAVSPPFLLAPWRRLTLATFIFFW